MVEPGKDGLVAVVSSRQWTSSDSRLTLSMTEGEVSNVKRLKKDLPCSPFETESTWPEVSPRIVNSR